MRPPVSSCHTRVIPVYRTLRCYHKAVSSFGAASLDLLVTSTLWHRSRPVSFGCAARTFRRTTVGSMLDESGPTLDGQVVSRIVVELERCYQAVRRISRVGALGLTERRRMGPEAGLGTHYRRFPHQQVALGATERDQCSDRVTIVTPKRVQPARSVDASVQRNQRLRTLDRTTSRNRPTPVPIRFALQPGRTTQSVSPGAPEHGTTPCGGVQLYQTQMGILKEEWRTLDRMTVWLR